ncbi:MAG: hypothetical protein OZ948_03865 [Deltaproteobacteria bacterium]|nr:hypothetical protein [Deltaproteobacteria bacterium]
MQNLPRLASVLGIAILAAAAPVRAAVVANCEDLDRDIAECADFSDDGVLEFDLSLLTLADVALEIQTTSGERTIDLLTLRAYVYNDSYLADEVAFTRVELRLDGGARFVPVGTVRNFDFELVPVTRPDDVTALIEPSPPLPPTDLLEIGELDAEPGATDWEIDLSQLSGTSFTLRVVSVPEPDAAASAALGLLALAALAQGSSRRRC